MNQTLVYLLKFWGHITISAPRSRPCSLEEQYFKCGFFWDYDAPQRRVSNSEAPVLAGGIHVFLRGSQFSSASELKEELVCTNWHKLLNVKSARRSWLPPRSLGPNAQWMERKGENSIFAKHAISLCKHKQDSSTTRNAILEKDLRRSLLVRNAEGLSKGLSRLYRDWVAGATTRYDLLS